MHGNITITLRVSPQRAIMIYNRLYACGELSREKWLKIVEKLQQSKESNLAKKEEQDLQKPRTFYENLKKNPR